MRILLLIVLTISANLTSAQEITGKVIDRESGYGIPFVNLTINNTENKITTEEGAFTLSDATDPGTDIHVSALGYKTRKLSVADLQRQQNLIALSPIAFDLDTIKISNVRPDPYKIMENVKKNLTQNYSSNRGFHKDRIFVRQTSGFTPKQLELKINSSTGYTKEALKETNSTLSAFSKSMISAPPKDYTDLLCNYYTGLQKNKDNKSYMAQKFEVLRAVKLSDDSRSASLDMLQLKAAQILLKHLDTTKHYRLRSGLLGSRDTVPINRKNKKKNSLSDFKTDMHMFLHSASFTNPRAFDFVNQPELYSFTYDGAILSEEYDIVYVLSFKPKKSKANYVGKIYVSESDHAIVKCDYALPDGEKLSGINLKLLLGVKQADNLSRGTIIYKANKSEPGYYLQYASIETGSYTYFNRPLKFIELSEEEKDVVAFDLKVECNTRDKTEFLNMSRETISEETLTSLSEKDFSYLRLRKYDPKIWKDFIAIEPHEEMKKFNSN